MFLHLQPIAAGSESHRAAHRALTRPWWPPIFRHITTCVVLFALTVGAHTSPARASTGQSPSTASPEQLLAQQQYTAALTIAERALAAHPTDAHASLVKSLALAGAGRTSASLASFDQTLRLTHDSIPVLEAASQVAYQARDPRAATYLNRLIARDPANQVAHAMAGVLAYERHDCPAANTHFARAADALRGNVDAEVQQGDCLLATDDTASAVLLFERLASEHPERPDLQYDRAVAYVQESRCSDAVPVLQALDSAGDALGGDTLNLLGAAFNCNHQLEKAIDVYRRAAQQRPHDARNYIDLATLSMEHESPAAALDILNAGIQQNPRAASLIALRGAVRAQTGDNDAATADFEAADRLQPSRLYGAVGLGVLLRDSSKLQQAEQLLRTRLRSHPADPTLHYLLADVLVREGAAPGEPRFTEARRLLKRAIALDPTLAVAYGELGKLDLKTGHTEEAIAELESGVRYDPSDRTSLNQLVAAYRRVGRTADAARVAARLGSAVEHDRAEQSERNRVHLTTAPSQPAAPATAND